MATGALSNEKSFAYLIIDDIQVEKDVLDQFWDGDGSSLYKIGQIYYKKNVYTIASEWFRLGAAKYHSPSQFKIGYMYHDDQGLPVDYKLAMEWYLKAYHNGSIVAASNIGCLYGNAQGVARDHKLALKWFLEAANKANACSQYNVGVYYKKGLGVKVDKQYALEWFEKSAEQGYEKAKDSIKCLNEEGYYIDDKQRNLEEQKSKNETLENQLKELKQKRLHSNNENKLLKQENKVLKLKNDMDTKHQVNTKQVSTQQLEEGISKVIANWVSSATTKNPESDGNPENDICYDE